ncbi:MAG TPA: hypothetical protein PKA74_12985 [Bauldia sp.]|mgnify:CR=1 FL=1|nr:hypothetical protein [Bauldia sp.]
MPTILPALRTALAAAAILAAPAALAQSESDDARRYPTTEFADGATSASVTSGGVTADISMVRRADVDPDFDVPLLKVTVGGTEVIEIPGIASGFDFPAAEASIAELDPSNAGPEVYFTSYSGGAHCCSTVIVADEVDGKWQALEVGEFDGDGNYLGDLDADGVAEIATVDNAFLYQFDCYACSAAPLVIYTVKDGKVVDSSADPRFLAANRDWLKQIEDAVDPGERWTSPGYLAGWVAAKARLGEGDAALAELKSRWNYDMDEGEEVCVGGGEPEDCVKRNLQVLKFPERLELFLRETGYLPKQ